MPAQKIPAAPRCRGAGGHDSIAPMPARLLCLLTAVVLAAHLLVLRGLALPPAAAPQAERPALRTRVLPSPPAPATAPPPPVAATAPVRRVRPAPAPRRQPPRPAATATTPPAAPAVGMPAPAPVDAPADLAAPPAADESDWLAQVAANTLPAPGAQAAAGDPAPHDHSGPAQAASTPAPPDTAPAPAPTPADSAAAPPVAIPPAAVLSFEARGRVKGFDYRASAELSWLPEGGHYLARQKVSAFLLGSRSQESTGTLGAAGLRPQRFVDQFRSARTAQFDYASHEVRFSDGASATAPIGDGAQDRLSVFFQLGALLAADPARYPPGTRIAFETVGARRVDRWVFSVQGPERLDLPLGPTAALKLQRVHDEGSDQKDELWLGTELHYLPVRIRLAQDHGDFADLSLASHETP